jgi:hypothetical protein
MKSRVRMLESRIGSDNGYTVSHYIKGRIYEISDFLLEAFILGGSVELLDTPPDDGFIDPLEFGGHDEEAKGTEPQKRGRGRPKKNAI